MWSLSYIQTKIIYCQTVSLTWLNVKVVLTSSESERGMGRNGYVFWQPEKVKSVRLPIRMTPMEWDYWLL